ncbi:MAG: hypothetical protein RIA63_15510 [Cyclobacteriaceae bacterium]
MDEFHDGNLKNVFAKLGEYESPQKGVSWIELKKHLGGDAGWSKAMVLSLGLLLSIGPAGIVYQNQSENIDDSAVNQPASQAVRPEVAIQPLQVNVEVDKPEADVGLQTYSAKPEEKPDVIKLSSQISEPIANAGSEYVSRVEPIENEDMNIDNEDIFIEAMSADSIDLATKDFDEIDDSESAIQARSFSVSFSSFYSLGIVNPITTDTEVLSNYESKPGFGFKLDVSFPILKTSSGVLEIGPTYMFMRKSFDFKVFNYGPEAFSESINRMSVSNHYAGLKIRYLLTNPKLNVGTTFYRSIVGDNRLNNYMGTGLVLLNVSRDFQLKNPDLSLFAKGSFGFPVLGKISTFRYNPIQLEIGVRRSFSF